VAAALLLVAVLLAASSPAIESTSREALQASAPASAVKLAEKRAPSSMLRESGYAIAKDKLD